LTRQRVPTLFYCFGFDLRNNEGPKADVRFTVRVLLDMPVLPLLVATPDQYELNKRHDPH